MKSKTASLITIVHVYGLFLCCAGLAVGLLAKDTRGLVLVIIGVVAGLTGAVLTSMNKRLEALEAMKETPLKG